MRPLRPIHTLSLAFALLVACNFDLNPSADVLGQQEDAQVPNIVLPPAAEAGLLDASLALPLDAYVPGAPCAFCDQKCLQGLSCGEGGCWGDGGLCTLICDACYQDASIPDASLTGPVFP